MKLDRSEVSNFIQKIVGNKLLKLYNACEMMIFDFGDYQLHASCLTRVSKKNDILVTTLDYQNWDGKIDTNNDEWFFVKKYQHEIVGGTVLLAELSSMKDLKIMLDNDITIELYISNGYNHYDDEVEQWRLIKKIGEESTIHLVVNSKTIDYID
ncbi:MAG: hypothetical protein Q4D45_03340 [Lachnospiraceae bacterium]|nr:hypothetical protein [Lachnospiraceae bacterium]